MKKIKFVAIDKRWSKLQPSPKPARLTHPDWYKNTPSFYPENKLRFNDEGKNMTFKKCLPFIDSLNAGYVIELRKDILIQENSNDDSNHFDITWNADEQLIKIHNSNTKLIDPPENYHRQVVTYQWNYITQTPKGYSCLFTEPLAYQNSVFKAIPAIVDTDKEVLNFHLSMWLKKDFTGIIPKGTPIAQIIPFKRDDWKMESSYLGEGEYDIKVETGFNASIINHYKKTSWTRKRYK